MELKSNRREFAHTKELSGDGRAGEQLTLAKIRELIQSTTLTWPAAIPLFHWLCCLFPIGYLPKPTSVDRGIYHHHRIQPRPLVKVIFRYCWYYLRPDSAVSTSTDTQHLWAFWHSSNTPILSMYLSTIPAVFTPAGHVSILQNHMWV